MVRSINEDVAYTATTSPLEWQILCDGNVIATGVSERRPDQEHVTIYPNRIVEDYLHSEFPVEDGVTKDWEACKEFTLADSGGTVLETYVFYDGSVPVTGEIINEPVNGHCDPRQRIYLTRLGDTYGSIVVTND